MEILSKIFNRIPNKVILLMLDSVLIMISLSLSCFLTGEAFSWSDRLWLCALVLAVVVKLIVFIRSGLYSAVLRYASIDFLAAVLKANLFGSLGLVFLIYIIGFRLSPRTLVLDWLLTVTFIGGLRFTGRFYYDIIQRFRNGKRVLIYGAGDLGVMALRQLNQEKRNIYTVVGFLDDDVKKTGKKINSAKVFGGLDVLDHVLNTTRVEEIVVAIADVDSEKLRDLIGRCKKRRLICRILPCFSKMMAYEPMMRKVEIADLMRRPVRDLNEDNIEHLIKGKRIFITGAAGSIGSEIVRQCLRFKPAMLIALDQSENGLYLLGEELGHVDTLKLVLADVTKKESMEPLFRDLKPQIVFHAAAYKHVPMLEFNQQEAINNNIGGTMNVADLSDEYRIEKFVLISTDKAVRPKSTMGCTKKMCELYIRSFYGKSETDFIAVRFGNVLGSSGSVIPKFIEQIKNGGPVTVTHPEATRYFMIIDEAVQLVLQAAAIGESGQILILNMGKPVKIAEMAEDLIYLMGREPHKEIEIKYTGLRPGEKIYEELFNDEIEKPTIYKDISIGKSVDIPHEELVSQVNEALRRGNIDFIMN